MLNSGSLQNLDGLETTQSSNKLKFLFKNKTHTITTITSNYNKTSIKKTDFGTSIAITWEKAEHSVSFDRNVPL